MTAPYSFLIKPKPSFIIFVLGISFFVFSIYSVDQSIKAAPQLLGDPSFEKSDPTFGTPNSLAKKILLKKIYTSQTEDTSVAKKEIQPTFKLSSPTSISTNNFPPCSDKKNHTHTLSASAFLARVSPQESIGDYIPERLIQIQEDIPTKWDRKICLEETAAQNLKNLFLEAKSRDLDLIVTSGYRSKNTQSILYERAEERGRNKPVARVAKPTHSEHQLGITVDLASGSDGYSSASKAFGGTPEGIWVGKNAHRHGFTLSYPEGKESLTGYVHEPWHFRFIGIKNATHLYNEKKTLNEVLFKKDEHESHVEFSHEEQEKERAYTLELDLYE